jgi:hypothetical protein
MELNGARWNWMELLPEPRIYLQGLFGSLFYPSWSDRAVQFSGVDYENDTANDPQHTRRSWWTDIVEGKKTSVLAQLDKVLRL